MPIPVYQTESAFATPNFPVPSIFPPDARCYFPFVLYPVVAIMGHARKSLWAKPISRDLCTG